MDTTLPVVAAAFAAGAVVTLALTAIGVPALLIALAISLGITVGLALVPA